MATCWDISGRIVYNRGIALRLIQPKSDKKAIMNKEEEKEEKKLRYKNATRYTLSTL